MDGGYKQSCKVQWIVIMFPQFSKCPHYVIALDAGPCWSEWVTMHFSQRQSQQDEIWNVDLIETNIDI